MNLRKTPDAEEVLTLDDIDQSDLPNGTATVLTILDQFEKPQGTAVIDDSGYARKVGDGSYIPLHYTVRPRE